MREDRYCVPLVIKLNAYVAGADPEERTRQAVMAISHIALKSGGPVEVSTEITALEVQGDPVKVKAA